MLFETPQDRNRADAIARLTYCNPFLPERMQCEREALGEEYVESENAWHLGSDPTGQRPNLATLTRRVEEVAARTRARLVEGVGATPPELRAYEDLVMYLLYCRNKPFFERLIGATGRKPTPRELAEAYEKFVADVGHFLGMSGVTFPDDYDPPVLFACFFQIRRAFAQIFNHLVGGSMPAAQLRAAAWQSIFTHDMRRYRRVMYDRMGDITTLITGPSGTGKELVARAIGHSRYIPFDPKKKEFTEDFAGSFHALNLSALSPTLIESELFGHRRGAFTGALEDRAGWMEVCPPLGTVFLDEIGELDPAIQVKLLRVLQTRTFQRLGDTATRVFRGKIIAATNRDLGKEMAEGSFRKDFYYRLCSDIIRTPTLREQVAGSPREMRSLILFIAERVAGTEEAEAVAGEVHAWVGEHLGDDYAWPGNFRELEQCVRNVLIRREYHPPQATSSRPAERLVEDLEAGRITAEQLLQRYCSLVYSQTRNYEETARRLGLDRRTVKSKVSAADGGGDSGNESHKDGSSNDETKMTSR
jgi:transcriptional regulator with AAA-type ATPase domain